LTLPVDVLQNANIPLPYRLLFITNRRTATAIDVSEHW